MTKQIALEIITNIVQRQNVTKENDLALAIVQKATEKQIPQKPIKLKTKQDIKIGAGTWKLGITVYKCPRCDSFISRSSNYCVKCGQALDWSDD